MPQTLCALDTVIPGNPSPACTEPMDNEQAQQPVLGRASSSAFLDILIQHPVPTADYYLEVGSGQQNEPRAGQGEGLWLYCHCPGRPSCISSWGGSHCSHSPEEPTGGLRLA